jgi:tetratricopeptide (TPR) repeat protein
LYPDRLPDHAERLAHHAVRGALWHHAVRYLRQAGEKAAARSADREAIALFEQALAALSELPESRETLSEALDIHIALGPCLGVVYPRSGREYEAAYVAAKKLCDRLNDRSRLFPALWGLWHVSLNRGHYREARDLAGRLVALAREQDDPVLLVEAHHSLWPTLYGSGDLEAADLHAREGLRLYDAHRHRVYASVYGGHDTGVCCLSHAAVIAWTRGYPERALRYSQEALRLADQVSHPSSEVLAFYYSALVHYQRGELQAAVEQSLMAREVASAHGIHVDARATMARFGLARPLDESELDQLHETLRVPWWRWWGTFLFSLLAEGYARAGRPDKGLEVLAAIPESALELVSGPVVHRAHGELLLGQGDAHASEAENWFRMAVNLARRHGSHSLELRAATSLSRLLARGGKREEARRLLGDAYGWFTEGFETGDLKAAREELDSLEHGAASRSRSSP